jgi:hypothetical protein
MGEHNNDLEDSGVMYYRARDEDGNRVTAASAEKGKKHFCFGCNGEYILRRGEIKVPHFAHKPTEGVGCSPESAAYKEGKGYLKELFDSGGSISVQVECKSCKEVVDQIAFSGTAKEEYSPNSGLRIDVAVFKDGRAILFIEVYYAHKVDDRKIERLTAAGVPWIELYSHEIVAGKIKPFNFSSHFSVEDCDDCRKQKAFEQERQEKLQAEAKRQKALEEERQAKLRQDIEKQRASEKKRQEQQAAAAAAEEERRLRRQYGDDYELFLSAKRACKTGYSSTKTPTPTPPPKPRPKADLVEAFWFYKSYDYSSSELEVIRNDLTPVQLEWFNRLSTSDQNTWFWLSCWQQHRLGTPKQEARRVAARAVREIQERAI